jgi:inhibitor of cysteine peptidase
MRIEEDTEVFRMRTRNLLAWAALGGALLLTGCLGPLTVREADQGKIVSLGIGDPLIVELEGNPSTGYAWERVGKLAETILRPVSEGDCTPENDLPGSPATCTFRYQASSTGTTRLEYAYRRSWETEVLGTFAVTVVVR